jgi:hypothetical protein
MLSSFNEPLKSMAAQDEILLHTFGDFQRRRLVDFPFRIFFIFCVVMYPFEDLGEEDIYKYIHSSLYIYILLGLYFQELFRRDNGVQFRPDRKCGGATHADL